jgi:hypothetical protein
MAQQALARLLQLNQRHRPIKLVRGDEIDLHRVHPIEALGLDAANTEAGLAHRFADLGAGPAVELERDGEGEQHGRRHAEEDQPACLPHRLRRQRQSVDHPRLGPPLR